MDKLRYLHIIIIIYMIQVGITVFRLPRVLADNFGYNGWIALVVVWAIVSINIWLIGKVYAMSRGREVFQIIDQTVPQLMSYPIYFVLGLFYAFSSVIIAKNYLLIMQMLSYTMININTLVTIFMVLTFILLLSSFHTLVKATVLFFFFTFWIIFLFVYILPDMSLVNFTPFILKGETHLLEGFIQTYAAFLGFEAVLLFFPYVNQQSKFVKGLFMGNLLTGIVYLIIGLLTYGFYSFEHLSVILNPTINLFKYIETPLIQRLENIVFAILMLNVLVTCVFYFWISKELFKHLFPKLREGIISFILVFSTFIVSFYFTSLQMIEETLTIKNYIQVPLVFGIPLLLILFLWVQQKSSRGELHAGHE
jgi:spore germination protein (amino acid permease)